LIRSLLDLFNFDQIKIAIVQNAISAEFIFRKKNQLLDARTLKKIYIKLKQHHQQNGE